MSGYQSGPTLRLNVFKNLKVGKIIGFTFREEGASIGHELVGYFCVTRGCQEARLQGGARVLSVEGELVESPLWQGSSRRVQVLPTQPAHANAEEVDLEGMGSALMSSKAKLCLPVVDSKDSQSL
jgi:hypothetical protein